MRKGYNKFGNKRVYDCNQCDNYVTSGTKTQTCICGAKDWTVFDSWREFTRFAELKLQEKAGMIKSLQRQTRFPVLINGLKCFSYVADYTYYDQNGNHVVEDSKGSETDVFKLKKKCVEAYYGIHIKITK